MILVDEGAYVHYVEGCTAPTYSEDSLHAAVVEIIVKKGGRCRYTTIQNWSSNVYNLVTKRAVAHEDATMEWVDGNLGSKLTMKYPAILLKGRGAHGEVLVDRLRGRGTAPGRRREDHASRARHVVGHHVEVDLARRRPRDLPRPAQGRRGLAPREVVGRLRRADPRRGQPLGHVPVHQHRRERRHDRPRGDRLEDRRGAALLPDEPRALRDRGRRADRRRVRGADHEGAPARVRGRDEPADPAPDGRVGRLAGAELVGGAARRSSRRLGAYAATDAA